MREVELAFDPFISALLTNTAASILPVIFSLIRPVEADRFDDTNTVKKDLPFKIVSFPEFEARHDLEHDPEMGARSCFDVAGLELCRFINLTIQMFCAGLTIDSHRHFKAVDNRHDVVRFST